LCVILLLLYVMSCTDMPRPQKAGGQYLALTMGDKLYAMTKIYHTHRRQRIGGGSMQNMSPCE